MIQPRAYIAAMVLQGVFSSNGMEQAYMDLIRRRDGYKIKTPEDQIVEIPPSPELAEFSDAQLGAIALHNICDNSITAADQLLEKLGDQSPDAQFSEKFRLALHNIANIRPSLGGFIPEDAEQMRDIAVGALGATIRLNKPE